VAALIERPEELLRERRVHGLIGGFVAGLAIGAAVLAAGVPDIVAVLVAAVVNYVVTMWLPTILLPPADRRLSAIVHRLAANATLAWRRAYGAAPIPRTEEQQLLWIAAQPATTTDPDALSIEGSVLLVLGRYAAARERAERLPDDAPWWRFDRALAFAAIEFDSGAGPGDLSAARAAAEAVHGDRRARAIAALGLEEASRALIRGDDWDPPIARAASASGGPLITGALNAVVRSRTILPWLLVSEVGLAILLSLLRTLLPA
jgi:hypothetical protein